ncbi:MAG: sulfotransferase, partial [Chloroflexi bacterium]|nr:sulfotransferase [Chloroflexota bacterium]
MSSIKETPRSHSFVFVTGLHRSGTSLLHGCLREHPQISGFHNTGVSEDEGQHLQTVLPRAIGGPGRFGRHGENHLTETHPLARPETAQELFAQWSPHWDLSRPYLVEKSPPTLLRTRLFQSLFPNCSFVVIVRHPAAVALATFNALASAGWLRDLTIAELIEHWLFCHETFQEDAPHLQHLHMIRYEDFVNAPQLTLDAIYAGLSLAPHRVEKAVDPHANIRYQAQWRAMSEDPEYQADIARAIHFEDRVSRFGYSLRDWGASEPDSAMPILETERLRLRRLTFADVDILATLYADPETTQFLDGPRTREQVWGGISHWLGEYTRTGLGY